jgi:hypothetical protein
MEQNHVELNAFGKLFSEEKATELEAHRRRRCRRYHPLK